MSLVRKELARSERSGALGDDAFRFRHILICDSAYQAIPKERRAELHEGLADWIAHVGGEGKSGWWWLIGLVPFGWIVLLVFLASEGDRGWNRYGPPPGVQAVPPPPQGTLPRPPPPP
jgi:hypothetical protein